MIFSNPTYTYVFSDIGEQQAPVIVTNHSDNKQYTVYISVDDIQHVTCNTDSVPAQVADLVDLAVAVYTADRLSIRQGDNSCHIHVVLPIRYPEVLGNTSVLNQLQDTLYWYTEDHWSFSFLKRTSRGRLAELQRNLPFTTEAMPTSKVALWSGGLDSLAGLCNSLINNPTDQNILFGTGGNTFVHSVQQKVFNAVSEQFPKAQRMKLIQVPFHLSETRGMKRSRDLRVRGFVFLLLGAACAYLRGQDTLYIYENGIGAINLPFRASEVGLDHARSVHPMSLMKMGELISLVLGSRFVLQNPFLFRTKGEMCQVFTHSVSPAIVPLTISCDRRHRHKITQCGWCSSCLFRRQALAVNGVIDETPYVVIHARSPQPLEKLHLQAMLHQVDILRSLLAISDPWLRMTKQYQGLEEIADELAAYDGVLVTQVAESLTGLYKRYVSEWDELQNRVGFLEHNEMQLARSSDRASSSKGKYDGYQYP